MTEEYKTKLIKLARDLQIMQDSTQQSYSHWNPEHQQMFASKLNYMLGYILALDDNAK